MEIYYLTDSAAESLLDSGELIACEACRLVMIEAEVYFFDNIPLCQADYNNRLETEDANAP